MDSNHGPPRYKLGALPTELYSRKIGIKIVYPISKKENP